MYSDKILNALTSAYLDLPREVLSLCRFIGSVMHELGSSQTTVNEYFGAMLFQRYICPALVKVSPTGLRNPKIAQPALMVLSRSFANIGTTSFSQPANVLSSLNPYIRDTRPSIEEFYRCVTVWHTHFSLSLSLSLSLTHSLSHSLTRAGA